MKLLVMPEYRWVAEINGRVVGAGGYVGVAVSNRNGGGGGEGAGVRVSGVDVES